MTFSPQFSCQRSGGCCTHPNIVVTLTHTDLWVLFEQVQDIEDLKKLIQFIILEPNTQQEKLVLETIKTTNGEGSFILRKTKGQKCIFYDQQQSMCDIHTFRPQACRNFPFAFAEQNNEIIISLVKDASSFCLGIGKGKEYTKEELQKVGRHTLDTIKHFNEIVDEINKESKVNKPLTPHDALMTLLLVGQKEKESIKQELQIL